MYPVGFCFFCNTGSVSTSPYHILKQLSNDCSPLLLGLEAVGGPVPAGVLSKEGTPRGLLEPLL